jgi:putative phosphoesterase
MKYMIASDLHGDAACTRALLDRFDESGACRLLLLGDLLYHGPRNDLPTGYAPKEVIALLTQYRNVLLCVRGNCDTEVDQMVLPFPILSELALVDTGRHVFCMTHGHKQGEDNPPPLRPGELLLCGHTHVSRCARYETYTYLNPGSVSIPKEGTPHSYATLEGNRFEWKTLDGEAYRTELL